MPSEMLKGGALPGVCAAAVAILCVAIPALTTLAAQEKPAHEAFPAYLVILTPSLGVQDTDTGAAPRVFSAVMMPVDEKQTVKISAAALKALITQQKP